MTTTKGPTVLTSCRPGRTSARVGRAAAAATTLLLSLGLLAPAADAAPGVILALSRAADRSAPVALDGSTVTGNAYIFTTPDDGVRRVEFYLDDPSRSQPPRRVETWKPFDLAGTTGASAAPLDSTTLPDGGHTVTAVVTDTAGATSTVSATFTVANSAPPPPPPPPAAELDIRVSVRSDRGAAAPLSGATLSGPAYVFTAPDAGVRSVSFWVDDPSRSGPPRHVENYAPFDLVGGSASAAQAFDTTTLTNGSHTISVTADTTGGPRNAAATFTVDNPPAAAGGYTYSAIRSVPGGSTEGQSVVIGGRLYAFGGFDLKTTCCTATDRAAVFDPAAGTWTSLPPMPDGGVSHAGMTADDRYVYYAGGYVPNGRGGQIYGSAKVFRYDTVARTYTRLPDLPAQRAAGQLVWLAGTLRYFGGQDITRTVNTPDQFVLDVTGGATNWTTAAPMPQSVNHLGKAVLDGKVYAVGGEVGHGGDATKSALVEIYDPASDTWTYGPSLPVARSHIANTTFALDGRVVVAGGELANYRGSDRVDAYDPATDRWTSSTPLPEGRRAMVGGALPDHRFVVAGGGQGGWIATPN